MTPKRYGAALVLLGLTGCVRAGFGVSDTAVDGIYDGADIKADIKTDIKADIKAEDCTINEEGKCHPANNGTICLGGGWQMPKCTDTVNGCGTPPSPTKPGYCDPNWSDCVAPQPKILQNCDDYCQSIGMKCCDAKKQILGECTAQQRCITSRGYHRSTVTGTNWGAEAWNSEADCRDPQKMGVGQEYCDGEGTPWSDSSVRHRCCCFPVP